MFLRPVVVNMADAESDAIKAGRAKLAARMGESRTGGKGSVRRKKKAVHKTATADDKKLGRYLPRPPCLFYSLRRA
jgi:hypothetical protein